MEIKAHAKINVCLNVVEKRSDGYHELEMIMVPLTLHDVIHIEFAKSDLFTCSDETLVMDASNTVVKAVELMRHTFQLKEHFHVHVDKHIPAQAGLAGGSADGAAVMRAISSLCELPITLEELSQLGKQIGADIPFCVMQCCAMVSGIGEKIIPFTNHCDFDILLVKPKAGVSTGKAFSLLNFDQCDHPDFHLVKNCLVNNDFEELRNRVSNSLEYSAFQLVPEIATIKQSLLDSGFPIVLMSGSGSTVFALTRNVHQLNDAMKAMEAKGYFVCKTKIL